MARKTDTKQLNRRKIFLLSLLCFIVIIFYLSLPNKLFKSPTSTILYSNEGKLLGARIASDGQWRFPKRELAPKKFEKALLCFEDRYFYYHLGVNPISILRAAKQNIIAGHIVSGGSTISMQLIRLSRKGKSRSIYQKIIETILAIRLELSYSKDEILAMYASHAPFGGNVVGIDAASWRFFGRSADDLSWAESATLAVLPNAPSLIFPGKNSKLLLLKRNRLLDKMLKDRIIDSTTCKLAKLEQVPSKIDYLPRLTPHLLDRANMEHKGEQVNTTIQYDLQRQINNLLTIRQTDLIANKIYNAAVLVVNVENGACMAYVGNTPKIKSKKNGHGYQVDIIKSARSTGSILKPFLFSAMLDEGQILQSTLIPDIPTQIGGYSPKNFDLKYTGAIPARTALARSLNIPAVRMLRTYGVERFLHLLKSWGISTLSKSSEHYGLSLILGGAEASLWDICKIYADMARYLNKYTKDNENTNWANTMKNIYYEKYEHKHNESNLDITLPKAGAIFNTFEALLEVNRPDGENGWQTFNSSRKIAWKTGTSFGFRDAWAIGVTSKYVVGVWVGNADGEGRPGLTGVSKAAPIMFDVFNLLPRSTWFSTPYDDMETTIVCNKSGYKASRWCKEKDTILVSEKGLRSPPCPYHHLVHLDKNENFQVNLSCISEEDILHKRWFTLPPTMEWYYKLHHPMYRNLPPFKKGCVKDSKSVMEMIYPRENEQIFAPIGFDGVRQKIVFEVAHSQRSTEIFWYIDKTYIGKTRNIHQMEVTPSEGSHILTLTDELGNILIKKFTIIGKDTEEIY